MFLKIVDHQSYLLFWE